MPQLSRKRAERRKNKKQNKVKIKQTDVERDREHVNAAIIGQSLKMNQDVYGPHEMI